MRQLLFTLAALLTLAACSDDEFTTSQSARLTFSTDTVKLDTVFSRVPSTTKTFMVFNTGSEGIRISNVRLQRGNQTGFRVNVDGTYLGETAGYQTSNLEIRGGDSLRVFVEATTPNNFQDSPQQISDDLVFTLESGVVQKVNLNVWSWDAKMVSNLRISSDSTISTQQPIVVYGGITVDSAATLTIASPTVMYFHSDAGIDVYGTLKIEGAIGANVVLRGDRLDNMFSDLPYDLVPGQWQGIRIHSSSYGNELSNVDIHGGQYGIICDSTAYEANRVRLSMFNVTIDNCQGPGLQTFNSAVYLTNCQISNTLGDCFSIYGGKAQLVYCTLAQFYLYDANRGAALRFANYLDGAEYPLEYILCANSIVTGVADDVVMGESKDSVAYDYMFLNCLLRTPAVEDSLRFQNIIWETTTDSVQGGANFVEATMNEYRFDLHLDSLSRAVNAADPELYWHEYDRDGYARDSLPDIGCYELR